MFNTSIRRQKELCIACGIVMGLLFTWPSAWAIRAKVGPEYHEPNVTAPSNWGDTLQAQISLKDPLITWWQQFNDPLLNRLIEDAIHNNYNLQNALARIREVRALESAAVGRLLPQITSTNGYSRNRFSDNGTNPIGRFAQMGQNAPSVPGAPPPFNLGISNPTNDFRSGFDASWELDVFGYRRWQLEATRDRIQSSLENRRNVTISVVSEVARNYVELRQAQSRLAIAQHNIDFQQQSLNLTNQRYLIGIAPRQDSTQAATQLATLRANLPPLQATLENSAHALAILTGRDPNSLLAELSAPKPVPPAPSVVGLGLPASLILRRPDIRQAERELAATSADIGAARAQLYPTLRFTGSWGWEAIRIQDLYKWSSRYWGLNPTVTWPIFQRRELRSNVKVAQARAAQQEAQFRQAILNALGDVQDAVSNLESAHAQRESLSVAVAQSEQTVQLTSALYQDGLNNYLSVLDAKRNLANLQDRLAQSEATTTLQTIRLYKALGGGWEAF
jgi:multidrug efflux system outer membrane protein